MFFIQEAFAMAPKGTEGSGGPGGIFTTLLPFILMFAVFYFLLIRPQQRKAKKHQEFLSQLRKGDEVLTTGGVYGIITGIAEKVITLEISNDVKVKVSRSAIAGLAALNEQAK